MNANNGEGTFPIVTVSVNGVTCRPLWIRELAAQLHAKQKFI